MSSHFHFHNDRKLSSERSGLPPVWIWNRHPHPLIYVGGIKIQFIEIGKQIFKQFNPAYLIIFLLISNSCSGAVWREANSNMASQLLAVQMIPRLGVPGLAAVPREKLASHHDLLRLLFHHQHYNMQGFQGTASVSCKIDSKTKRAKCRDDTDLMIPWSAVFHQTLSVNRDPLDLFFWALLLNMISLGTPQLRGGVHIFFFTKCLFRNTLLETP